MGSIERETKFNAAAVVLLVVVLAVSITAQLASADGWTPAGSMIAARAGPVATLLLDGRVLVAGGYTSSGSIAAAEIIQQIGARPQRSLAQILRDKKMT